MNYSIEAGEHSADKDHTIMTWWTLKVDKTVRCSDGVTFYTYSIPMYSQWVFDTNFHMWVHAAEHMIAYKKDTWSVRNSLEEVTNGDLEWKVILDISPYKTSEKTFGFRITSMVPLENEQVQQLTKISVERAIIFLQSGKVEDSEDFQWIPFAREISCGQYDFHNKTRAIKDLQEINIDNLEIEASTIESEHTTAYVCDLRFLKPKTKWSEDMTMFSPDFSYKISDLIETHLPNKLPWSITIVWTFGCMTGMYLCISSEIWDETDIPIIHAAIIDIIKENIQSHLLNWAEKTQLDELLQNYENYTK
jgi:S-ribosylhomocysteine lyase LuxS involved in autoinducer biosynthesis